MADDVLDPVEASVDWSFSSEASMSLDRLGVGAALVEEGEPIKPVAGVEDDVWLDASAETASMNWAAAEADARCAAL